MFTFQHLDLEGLCLIVPKIFSDDRGFFKETYKKSVFEQNGIKQDFFQDNHSRSKKGVLRGLHYQIGEYAQGKLVRCSEGEVFDVAVDIRKGSKTFGQWYGVTLSKENHYMLYIPEGFAHGFYTLSDEAELIYKATNEYHAPSDRGIIWNDPDINIAWPSSNPILSPKDDTHPFLKDL